MLYAILLIKTNLFNLVMEHLLYRLIHTLENSAYGITTVVTSGIFASETHCGGFLTNKM